MQTRTETKLGQEPETKTNHRVREKKEKQGDAGELVKVKLYCCLEFTLKIKKGNALNNP